MTLDTYYVTRLERKYSNHPIIGGSFSLKPSNIFSDRSHAQVLGVKHGPVKIPTIFKAQNSKIDF
jgi:hypothetical protein